MKAVYIRTSTEDQEPENQIKDIETISGKEYILFQDKQSAWKDDKERIDFERLRKEIKSGKIKELYCWDLDRLFRNRKRLLGFFEYCKSMNCKIFSYRQKFINELQNLKLPDGFEWIGEMQINNFLQFLGWIAEDESLKKSGRVKNAVRKKDGKPTMSYKGNKWGRKQLSTQKRNKVIELYKLTPQLSLRAISEQSGVSLGMVWKVLKNINNIESDNVHKTIPEITQEKESELNVQDLVN